MIPYKQFSEVCKVFIDETFKFDTMVDMEKHYKLNETEVSLEHPATKDMDKIELFRTFKKYDRNMNGTLDFSEYTQCLTECPDITLGKEEIITVAMQADLNGDGEVDFEEFMKHFPNILNTIQMHKSMQKNYFANMSD